MIVGELIAELSKYPQDTVVLVDCTIPHPELSDETLSVGDVPIIGVLRYNHRVCIDAMDEPV